MASLTAAVKDTPPRGIAAAIRRPVLPQGARSFPPSRRRGNEPARRRARHSQIDNLVAVPSERAGFIARILAVSGARLVPNLTSSHGIPHREPPRMIHIRGGHLRGAPPLGAGGFNKYDFLAEAFPLMLGQCSWIAGCLAMRIDDAEMFQFYYI
jgi:hypothetical protein